MKIAYTAVLTPQESGNGYYARVPDLDGCITTGDDLPDTIDQIRDALSVYLLAMEDTAKPFPTPRLPDAVPHQPGDVLTLVDVDTLEYRKATDTTSVRKNVSIPAWMAYRADALNINVSNVLQNALDHLFSNADSGTASLGRGKGRKKEASA